MKSTNLKLPKQKISDLVVFVIYQLWTKSASSKLKLWEKTVFKQLDTDYLILSLKNFGTLLDVKWKDETNLDESLAKIPDEPNLPFANKLRLSSSIFLKIEVVFLIIKIELVFHFLKVEVVFHFP